MNIADDESLRLLLGPSEFVSEESSQLARFLWKNELIINVCFPSNRRKRAGIGIQAYIASSRGNGRRFGSQNQEPVLSGGVPEAVQHYNLADISPESCEYENGIIEGIELAVGSGLNINDAINDLLFTISGMTLHVWEDVGARREVRCGLFTSHVK